jgi:hypothetical protein
MELGRGLEGASGTEAPTLITRRCDGLQTQTKAPGVRVQEMPVVPMPAVPGGPRVEQRRDGQPGLRRVLDEGQSQAREGRARHGDVQSLQRRLLAGLV